MFEENAEAAARLGVAISEELPRVKALAKEWAYNNGLNVDNFAVVIAAAIFNVFGIDNPVNAASVLDWVRELRTKAIRDCAVLIAADGAVLKEAGPSLAILLQLLDEVEVALSRLLASRVRPNPPPMAGGEDRPLVEDVFGFVIHLATIGRW